MMTNDNREVSASSARKKARQLRLAAAAVLVLGIFGADGVYWLETRSAESPNVLPMVGEDKAVTQKTELMYGQPTVLVEEWSRALKRPGTQAVLIVVAAALAAGGCLYFAGLHDRAGKQEGETRD